MIKESRRLALVGLIAASISLVAMTVEAGILARLDQGEHLTVAAIGTSLTAPGGSWWLLHVGDWLKNKYPDQVIIDNLGIGGSNSRDSGLPQQLPTVLARSRRDIHRVQHERRPWAEQYLPTGIEEQSANDDYPHQHLGFQQRQERGHRRANDEQLHRRE